MKQWIVLAFALLLVSCFPSRSTVSRILYMPSRDRVLAAGDTEAVVTSWLALGLSFESAKPPLLFGLLLADAPLNDASHKPTGDVLPASSRVAVLDASAWEKNGTAFHRWYMVKSSSGPGKQGLVDSSLVALVTAERGDLAAGFLERKITIAGGDSVYNVLALSDKGAVTLIDTSALVFPDSFHPSGAARISIADVNGDGAPEIVIDADTIVSLQFLGASPLRWQAWLQEKKTAWQMIFRFNESYGTDQGNSYQASSRAFSSRGSGLLDTVKVTTDSVETAAQGEFHARIESFYLWDGEAYRQDASQELPQAGAAIGAAALLPKPAAHGAAVEALHDGDALFVFDRSDTADTVSGTTGFWYHAVSKSGKEGWIHAGSVKLSRIDPMKENRESFLGHSAFTPALPLSP